MAVGTWSGWTFLGGIIKADTSPVVARNNDGRLQVFLVGTNNQLQYRTQTSAGTVHGLLHGRLLVEV